MRGRGGGVKRTLALFALVLLGSFAGGAALGAALPDLGPAAPTAPAPPHGQEHP